MTDSVAVLPPGFRLTDSSTGAPLSGAVIRFYNAGTSTPKTVYADEGLTTALGTSVTTDSLGYPTSDGSTKTLVYNDTSSYKVRIETSAGVLIAEHDNVKGAVETATGGGGSTTLTRTVETKSLDYTVVAADQNKCMRGNCTGGDVTFTLPSAAAATIGNGWAVTIAHAGTANQIIIASVSSQTIRSGALSYGTTLALSNQGEEVTLVSDGGNWEIFQHTGPHIKRGQGVLTIADRLGAAPGSPVQGALYIVTGASTWGSTSMANHDIALFTSGSNWVKITPPTDCGWMAFVQDEDIFYYFAGSAWVAESATTSTAGTVRLADQAAMEAATAGRAVTADVAHLSPSACKAWVAFDTAGSASATSRVSGIVRNSAGNYTVSFATAFSSAAYCALPTVESSVNDRIARISAKSAGSCTIIVNTATFGATDTGVNFACFGDN